MMEISIQALVGSNMSKTIRFPRSIKRRRVFILIDSESTNSFIDEQLAQSLNCRMERIKPTTVTVAGGEKLISEAICNPITWVIQGLNSSIN